MSAIGQLASELKAHSSKAHEPHHLLVNVNRGIHIEEKLSVQGEEDFEIASDILSWLVGDEEVQSDFIYDIDYECEFHKKCSIKLTGGDGPVEEALVHVVYLDRLSLLEVAPDYEGGFRWSSYKVLEDFGSSKRLDSPAGKLLKEVLDTASSTFSGLYDDVDEEEREKVEQFCPILSNLKCLQRESVQVGVLDLLRSGEIASGRLYTLRDIWALLCQIIIGGNRPEFKSRHPCDLVKEYVKKGKLAELTRWRFFNSLFLDDNDPAYTPALASLKFIDPAADTSVKLKSVDEAMEMVSFDQIPSSTSSLGDIDEFKNCWLPLDLKNEEESFAKAKPAAKKPNPPAKRKILNDMGLSFYRLIGLITSCPANKEAMIQWLELRNCAEKDYNGLPEPDDSSLRRGLDALSIPSAQGIGSGSSDCYLPIFRSRVNPIIDPLDKPEICVQLKTQAGGSGIHWHTVHVGDALWIEIRDNTMELARVQLDYSICREALIAARGKGFTEFGANSMPRLERVRAAFTIERAGQRFNPVLVHRQVNGIKVGG